MNSTRQGNGSSSWTVREKLCPTDLVQVVNLNNAWKSVEGYYLTDDISDDHKWRIPPVSIPPKGELVLFASGKDCAPINGEGIKAMCSELHTNFKLNGTSANITGIARGV